MNNTLRISLVAAVFMVSGFGEPANLSAAPQQWVGTWTTSPQLVEPGNMPPAPGLTNNSLRQIVRVSLGGDTLRVRFSNEFSAAAVTMNSVQIAASTGGSTINLQSNRELRFNGSAAVTMAAGAAITSDPIAFPLTPRMSVAITLYFGQTSASVTGHPGSRTTSYIIAGNTTTTADFTGAVTTDHYELGHNYPNPFNPTTVVRSQLPEAGNVTLVVYDLLGRTIAVLVDAWRPPGYYQDTFDARGLASGLYIYRLTSGNFVQARKMIVVK